MFEGENFISYGLYEQAEKRLPQEIVNNHLPEGEPEKLEEARHYQQRAQQELNLAEKMARSVIDLATNTLEHVQKTRQHLQYIKT